VSARTCVVCERETPEDKIEEAYVRSNVRAFRSERFAFWRCAACRTLHARDEVDLARYYAQYSFHALVMDWRLRVMYGSQLARLRHAGVRPEHRILDYGCGGGQFVRYLQSRGYGNVRGFDEYSKDFGDRGVLDDRYDCIISQDVIEHVPSPRALVTEFQRLTKPDSVIALGTPNATAIHLERAENYVHTIHAPYHRHILSDSALKRVGEDQGWKLERYYPTMYSNTRFPFLNEAFYVYYTRITDDTLDALMEPVRVGALVARAPVTLFWGLFGSFFSRHTDVMAVFRRG
jgi:2-polyprenyl-3-methyl-5-hydroxy-6-metoxy-1,4-benzoquinol methylase